MKKVDNSAGENCDFKVWCEYCSIRIAPNEERIASDGKIYHQRCHAKYFAAASKVRVASSRSRNVLGGKKD